MTDSCLRLWRKHESGRIHGKTSEFSAAELEVVRLHGDRLVGAARCAASLALCGNAQTTELAWSLLDRVVDPGFAKANVSARAVAAEADFRERAEAARTLEMLEVAKRLCECGIVASLKALRAACRDAGLPTSGTKAALVANVATRGPAMCVRLSERLGRPRVVAKAVGSSSCVRPHLRTLITDIGMERRRDLNAALHKEGLLPVGRRGPRGHVPKGSPVPLGRPVRRERPHGRARPRCRRTRSSPPLSH